MRPWLRQAQPERKIKTSPDRINKFERDHLLERTVMALKICKGMFAQYVGLPKAAGLDWSQIEAATKAQLANTHNTVNTTGAGRKPQTLHAPDLPRWREAVRRFRWTRAGF